MKKNFFFLCVFILINVSVFAQVILNEIPDSLKSGMNEVVIFDHTSFEMKSLVSSTLNRSYRVIILNKFAEDRNEIYLYYDNFRDIKKLKATVYDKNNAKVKDYNLKDFQDYSTKSFSIASDSRAKYMEITHHQYPYILEVEYEIEYFTSYILPTWNPQSDSKQSLLSATFSVSSPHTIPIRHKSLNIDPDSIVQSDDDLQTRLSWSVSHLKGYKYEPFSFSIDRTPLVYLAPQKFEFDGFEGDMSTWEKFGEWSWELNKNRNTLTEDQLKPIHNMVKEAGSKEDTIRRVYDYVQENTHYVSVQLGIGGMQPFESGYVHENQYGDCKALSYYTQSILESVGVDSYYTLIYGGKYPMTLFEDFPDDYFNHIILTVPMEKDTIWLECTSQSNPFGNLGTFTGNRKGLMITENGGKLINTKRYELTDNIQYTVAQVDLQPDGKGIVSVKRTLQGMEVENKNFDGILSSTDQEKENWFIDKHNWGTMHLKKLQFDSLTEEAIPTGSYYAELELTKAGKITGNRIFYTPFTFTNNSWVNLPKTERKFPIHVRYPYSQVDTVRVMLPAGFIAEKEITNQSIETKYGAYTRSIIQEENTYLFIRKFDFYEGTYPADDYDAFRSFLKSSQKYDKQKLVFINKT